MGEIEMSEHLLCLIEILKEAASIKLVHKEEMLLFQCIAFLKLFL